MYLKKVMFLFIYVFILQASQLSFAYNPSSRSELCPNVIGSNNKIRYCRNRALSSYNDDVTRAVIAMPGSSLKAKSFYERSLLPNFSANELRYTNILVPQFLEDKSSNPTVLSGLGLSNKYLYWSTGWRQCHRARNLNRESSCGKIDFIVRKLIQYNPNLKHITLIGHSAGGQFVNRYASASNVEQYAKSMGVTMSYAVSSANSTVYLDSSRPNTIGQSCSSTYNKWKYGLQSRNTYASEFSRATMIDRLLKRNVYYFVGEDDVHTPGDCRVQAQGDHHVDRMKNYKKHLKSVCMNRYSSSAYCNDRPFAQSRNFKVIKNIGHNSRLLFATQHVKNIMKRWTKPQTTPYR